MTRKLTVALLALAVIIFSMTMGWYLFHVAYEHGRLDPDWSEYDMFVYVDEGYVEILDNHGHGCTWYMDAIYFTREIGDGQL